MPLLPSGPADVVKQRGQLQPLPRVRPEPVKRLRSVEQREREPRRLPAVRRDLRRQARERHLRSAACVHRLHPPRLREDACQGFGHSEAAKRRGGFFRVVGDSVVLHAEIPFVQPDDRVAGARVAALRTSDAARIDEPDAPDLAREGGVRVAEDDDVGLRAFGDLVQAFFGRFGADELSGRFGASVREKKALSRGRETLRFGQARERVFEVTSTEPIKQPWLGAYIEATAVTP